MIIAFEGIDGCGKSTQVRMLSEALVRRGHEVLTVADPGDSGFGWVIQRLAGRTDIDPSAAAMFFIAAKQQIFARKIQPVLSSKIVLLDRWIASTIAYQGYGYGRGTLIERLVGDTLPPEAWPDLNLLLDVDPVLGYRRCDDDDRRWIDRVGLAYMQRVREGFHAFASYDMNTTICRVQEEDTPAAIHGAILESVLSLL